MFTSYYAFIPMICVISKDYLKVVLKLKPKNNSTENNFLNDLKYINLIIQTIFCIIKGNVNSTKTNLIGAWLAVEEGQYWYFVG